MLCFTRGCDVFGWVQFRRNGDLYLTHCVETALILATTGACSAVVAAGLLHDAVDDSNLSPQLLRGAMGDDVADMVLGVSSQWPFGLFCDLYRLLIR